MHFLVFKTKREIEIKVGLHKLFLCEGCELIDTHDVSLVWFQIMPFDAFQVSIEHFFAIGQLKAIGIVNAVLYLPLVELCSWMMLLLTENNCRKA